MVDLKHAKATNVARKRKNVRRCDKCDINRRDKYFDLDDQIFEEKWVTKIVLFVRFQ